MFQSDCTPGLQSCWYDLLACSLLPNNERRRNPAGWRGPDLVWEVDSHSPAYEPTQNETRMSENKTSTSFIGLGRRMLRGTLVKETYSVPPRLTLWLGRVRMFEEFSMLRFTFLKISTLVISPTTCWCIRSMKLCCRSLQCKWCPTRVISEQWLLGCVLVDMITPRGKGKWTYCDATYCMSIKVEDVIISPFRHLSG